MAKEYKLSYTASEINEKLGIVDQNKESINVINQNVEALEEIANGKADADHTHPGQEKFVESEPEGQVAGDYWMLSY